MTAHLEVEDKYDVDEEAVLPALDGLDQVATVETVTHLLAATYFDTPDLALIRAGITLRRRTGGSDDGWHLKLPSGPGRHEIHVPVDPADGAIPQQLRDIVRAYARDDLTTTITLDTHRVEHRLLDSDGAALLEVCEDVVTATAYDETTTWREWEVESLDGDRDLLAAAGRLLVEAGATPSASPAKLARALAGRLPTVEDAPRPTRKKDPARLLVHARLAEQVDELRRHDPLVRADLPGGVHQMRVATRRLRATLGSYRPLLASDVTDPLRAELRWLGEVLGALRDSEVQRDHLDRALDELVATGAPDLVRGPVRARLRDHALADHLGAWTVALEALDSSRYLDLLDGLTELAAAPPWTPRAEASIRDVLWPRVRRDWRRLERLVKAGGPLHDVRKAAKRVRYAAEPLVPSYRRDAEGVVDAATRIQSVLGDHQDTVTARRQLLEIADEAAGHGENAFTIGVLHERQRELAADLETEFRRLWRDIRRSPAADTMRT
jgi:CHAD domain-containing protein